jgi:predicted nucleic acid-binding protein
MIAYLDASVILRMHLREQAPLREWKKIEQGVTSELAVVECTRAVDRYVHRRRITTTAAVHAMSELRAFFSVIEVFALSPLVLSRATEKFGSPLGTLDAIHLASALLCRDEQFSGRPFHFATHDIELATAARAMNFPVLGA